MIANLIRKLKVVVYEPELRNRVLFILGAFVIFRFLAAIPVPGVDPLQLNQLLASNELFGLLNIFSGGGLSQLSIVMLGVGPFITSSIMMQLLTIVFPKLKALYHEEGEAGRQKFNQYSRWITIPIAAIQGVTFLIFLNNQGILTSLTLGDYIINTSVIVAGAVFLMWVGELISEFGIGNGVSLMIFAGIVAVIPTQVSQLIFSFDISQLTTYIAFLAIAIVVIAGVVLVTEAERPIPVMYARHMRGGRLGGGVSTYLPLRINQAGVMPLIFALSILLFPQLIGNLLSGSGSAFVQKFSGWLLAFSQNGWAYAITYFVLVVLFTYFYTAITFDPDAVATNLQRNGAFVPGIRPGPQTSEYLGSVSTRITLVGATFLGAVAVLPIAIQSATGIQGFAIGGTALLIVVSVVLDLMKRVDAQVAMREY